VNVSAALKCVEILISFALIVDAIEFLSLQKYFTESQTSIWKWSELRLEHPWLLKLDFFLGENNFINLLWIRLLSAILFAIFPGFFLVLLLFISSLLISIRFRGSFNGGSDYMAQILLLSLIIAHAFPSARVQSGVLWYISLQVCTSYFIAGLVKLKQPSWRTGLALNGFISSPNYNPPSLIKNLFSQKLIALIVSWMVMIFEISFPLILIMHNNKIVLIWIGLSFLFHLGNVFLFGLNRFFLVWCATYPALYFVAKYFSNSP
jgi:hypothetical protein